MKSCHFKYQDKDYTRTAACRWGFQKRFVFTNFTMTLKIGYNKIVEQSFVSQKLQEITDKIVRQFEPEKIILFGSYAWGNPSPDSDVDLFIIKKTDRSTREVAREIDNSLWGIVMPIDIVVYTPENVDRRLQLGDFFIKDILHKGKILYSSVS